MYKMAFRNLRLVTFDVTGTLLNFRVPPPEKYVEVGKLYHVNVSVESVTLHFKSSWKYMSKHHPNFGKDCIGWERWWHQLVCKTFESSANPRKIDHANLDTIAQHLIKGYTSASYYNVYPHVENLLQLIQSKDISLGIISNFDDRLPIILTNLGLIKYFQIIVTSYNTGYPKPQCEIFEKALSGIESLNPRNALHVGNDPALDYLAAIKCGWNAALVNHNNPNFVTQQYPEIQLHNVFTDILQFKKYFEKAF